MGCTKIYRVYGWKTQTESEKWGLVYLCFDLIDEVTEEKVNPSLPVDINNYPTYLSRESVINQSSIWFVEDSKLSM